MPPSGVIILFVFSLELCSVHLLTGFLRQIVGLSIRCPWAYYPVLNCQVSLSLTSIPLAFNIRYMAGSAHFDRLVSDLTIEERQNLLGKMKSQSNMSNEPLYRYDGDDGAATRDPETEYVKLPWYYRLWYFILGYFKAKAPVKIYEDDQVLALGNKIEENTPGLYDCHNALLMPVFYRQVVRLKEAAQFFYSALDSSVNRDRGAFFAFLGSLEMADVHSRLLSETDPNQIAEKQPEISEPELRQAALKAMDDALAMITEEQRAVMYTNARSLNCLKGLSSYLYDRLIMAFNVNAAVGGETCSAGVVRELLISLNNMLLSLRVVPSMTLLESLFIFVLQERAGEPGFDINREIRLILSKAEDALAVIREFNKQVPLTWILRCSSRNMSLTPQEISGGEDWFLVFRDHWRRRIDTLFGEYTKNRRQNELLNTFRYFLKGKSLKVLEHTQTASNPDGLPIRGAFALSFLSTFYTGVLMPDLNWILRSILIDGEFQNKENRIEFTEGYNNLIKLEDEIRILEHEMSSSGDYGKRYSQAKQDMSSLPVKRRKVQLVVEEAQEDAEKILERAQDASRIMINILGGILGKDSRGKYFPLTNLPKLAEKNNKFVPGLGEIIQQFHTVLRILDDIEAMESGR